MLKNLTSYNEFKRLNEEWDYGNSFENSTGFSKSLVGRGLFSLFRFFKVSVDRFRLEFLKRELENEYFAGIIRLMDIDKEVEDAALGKSCSGASGTTTPTGTTTPPSPGTPPPTTPPTGGTPPPTTPPTTPGALPPHTTPGTLPPHTTPGALPPHTTPGATPTPTSHRLGAVKGALGPEVKGLVGDGQQAAEPTAAPEQSVINDLDDDNVVIDLTKANDSLAKISNLLKNKEKLGLDKNKIAVLRSIAIALQRRISREGTKSNESFEYDGFDLLTEELNKTKKLTIKEILGDSATNVNTNTLKYVINDLNWRCLAEYMRLNPAKKDEVNKLVNKDALRKIQYAAAKMIYHPVRTPSDMGPTPGKGGGTSKYGYGQSPELDTVLKNKWDKIVKNTLSLYAAVMSSTYMGNDQELIVDPYRLITLEEAFRSGNQYSGTYDGMRNKEDEFDWNNPKTMTALGINKSNPTNYGFIIFKCKSNGAQYYAAYISKKTTSTNIYINALFFVKGKEILNELKAGKTVDDIVNTFKETPTIPIFKENLPTITHTNKILATNNIITSNVTSTNSLTKYTMAADVTGTKGAWSIPSGTTSTVAWISITPTTPPSIIEKTGDFEFKSIFNILDSSQWGLDDLTFQAGFDSVVNTTIGSKPFA